MRLTTLLSLFFDAIAPQKKRVARVASMLPEHVAVAPSLHRCGNLHIITLTHYRDANTLALIQALKYDDSRKAATILALSLGEYLTDVLSEHALFSTRPVYIVPVPLHSARMRERGFNQISRVLDVLPEHQRALVREDMLMRVRNTPPQTRLSRRARLTNMAGAFAVSAPHNPHGALVFLIDDVTTTGATLAEAAHTLAKAGAEVRALALARA